MILNLTNLIEQLVHNPNFTLNLIESDTLISTCPHCHAVALRETKNSKDIKYDLWPELEGDIDRYVYDDGDTLNVENKGTDLSPLQWDTSFMQGSCRKCKELYFAAFLDISSKPFEGEEYFMLTCEVENYEKVIPYNVELNENTIGQLLLYKNGEYDGVIADYYRFTFGPFPLNVDMSNNEWGVSIHFENKEQVNHYYQLQSLLERILPLITEKIGLI